MSARSVAALGCAALLVVGPAAHADGATYRGKCGYTTANNELGGGALGGRQVWTGVAYLQAVPTDAGVPTGGAVTAWCELRVNGVSQGAVLGPVSGIGAVVAAGPFQFRADRMRDIVTFCTHVVTASGEEVVCPDETTAQIVPEPGYDVVHAVGSVLTPPVDAAACTVLGGDTFAGPYWLYDCPPYEESG